MHRGKLRIKPILSVAFWERQHMRAWNDAMLQPKPAPRKAIQTESRWTISPGNEA